MGTRWCKGACCPRRVAGPGASDDGHHDRAGEQAAGDRPDHHRLCSLPRSVAGAGVGRGPAARTTMGAFAMIAGWMTGAGAAAEAADGAGDCPAGVSAAAGVAASSLAPAGSSAPAGGSGAGAGTTEPHAMSAAARTSGAVVTSRRYPNFSPRGYLRFEGSPRIPAPSTARRRSTPQRSTDSPTRSPCLAASPGRPRDRPRCWVPRFPSSCIDRPPRCRSRRPARTLHRRSSASRRRSSARSRPSQRASRRNMLAEKMTVAWSQVSSAASSMRTSRIPRPSQSARAVAQSTLPSQNR